MQQKKDTKRTRLKVSLYAKTALGRWNQRLKLKTHATRMKTSAQSRLKVSLKVEPFENLQGRLVCDHSTARIRPLLKGVWGA